MRLLKSLLNNSKTTKQNQDSFELGLNRITRIQPTSSGRVVLFKARPKARAA
jgi:hypothetical protein